MQCDPACSSYSPCVTACAPISCDNVMDPQKQQRLCNSETCVEGCKLRECPEGSVYANTSHVECVPKTLCKPICLVEDEIVYYEGDVMTADPCHVCKCSRGSRSCSGTPCTSGIVDVRENDDVFNELSASRSNAIKNFLQILSLSPHR